MRLRETKHSIIKDGDLFWIAETTYILGFSWSYSLIGQESMLGNEIAFYKYSDAKKKLKQLNRYENN